MKHMILLVVLLLITSVFVPHPVSGQSKTTAEPPPNDEKQILMALLQEMRQLRVTLQRTQVTSLRIQLTLERVRLEQTHVDQVARSVESVQNRLNELSGVRPRIEEQLKGMQELMNEVVDPSKRVEMEVQLKEGKGRLGMLAREEDQLRQKEAEVSSELQAAQARLTDLHNQLDALVRELETQ